MATYAPIYTSIWTDPDFRALHPTSKLVYVALISAPKVSRCGVLDLMPGRWAAATGLTVDQVNATLTELQTTRFVLIDWDTSELAIRSKVRYDKPGTWQQVKAVWAAWDTIESADLRARIVYEFPEKCWAFDKQAPAPVGKPVGEPPDQHIHTHGDTHGPWDTQGDTDTPSREVLVTGTCSGTGTKSSSPVVPSPDATGRPDDDDQEAQLAQLARADLHRRTTEKGPVGNEPAWLAAATARHRKRLEHDPDYLNRQTPPPPRPTPNDPTATTQAAARALAQRHMTQLAAERNRPPLDPHTHHTAITTARNALHHPPKG